MIKPYVTSLNFVSHSRNGIPLLANAYVLSLLSVLPAQSGTRIYVAVIKLTALNLNHAMLLRLGIPMLVSVSAHISLCVRRDTFGMIKHASANPKSQTPVNKNQSPVQKRINALVKDVNEKMNPRKREVRSIPKVVKNSRHLKIRNHGISAWVFRNGKIFSVVYETANDHNSLSYT